MRQPIIYRWHVCRPCRWRHIRVNLRVNQPDDRLPRHRENKPIMTVPSLAKIRSATHSAPDHVFHASLQLYIMVEIKPEPSGHAGKHLEIACWKQGNVDGMVAYLSPLDTTLDLHARNRDGRRFRGVPLESIDPRPHIQQHNDWLTIYLAYGFAAHDGRLVPDQHGDLRALVGTTHFHVTPDLSCHFHFNFGEKAQEWLAHLHVKAGLRDYSPMLDELAESSVDELDRIAGEARSLLTMEAAEDITQCALYDPIDEHWRFVDLSVLPAT